MSDYSVHLFYEKDTSVTPKSQACKMEASISLRAGIGLIPIRHEKPSCHPERRQQPKRRISHSDAVEMLRCAQHDMPHDHDELILDVLGERWRLLIACQADRPRRLELQLRAERHQHSFALTGCPLKAADEMACRPPSCPAPWMSGSSVTLKGAALTDMNLMAREDACRCRRAAQQIASNSEVS